LNYFFAGDRCNSFQVLTQAALKRVPPVEAEFKPAITFLFFEASDLLDP
jgi:hypothetical protein